MIGAPPGDPRRSGRRHAARIRAGQRRPGTGIPQSRRPLAGPHQHRCIRCPKKYTCENACDPIGEGLDASVCPACFEEAQHPC